MYSAHDCDKRLLEQLGLTVFVDAPHGEWLDLGEVVGHGGLRVLVSVYCLPAQFWRFRVKSKDGGTYEWFTGSGSFGEYWQQFQPILDGIVRIQCIRGESIRRRRPFA